MTITLISDLGRLDKAIRMIAKRGEKLDNMIHVAALSAALAIENHGNIHYVNALYKACPRGARHAALTLWLTTYASVKANTGKDKSEKPFLFDEDGTVDLEEGAANPWFELKPSPEPDAVLNVRKLLEAVIKKARNPKEGQKVEGYDLAMAVDAILREQVKAASTGKPATEEPATEEPTTEEPTAEEPTDDEVLSHIA